LVKLPSREWGSRYGEFLVLNQRVQDLFERLTELRDRDLFYTWSRRVWDLKEELQLVDEFLREKKMGRSDAQTFRSETHLPGTYRGGLVARLQRLLRVDRQGGFHPEVPEDSQQDHERHGKHS